MDLSLLFPLAQNAVVELGFLGEPAGWKKGNWLGGKMEGGKVFKLTEQIEALLHRVFKKKTSTSLLQKWCVFDLRK